jgi:hypothetical protein
MKNSSRLLALEQRLPMVDRMFCWHSWQSGWSLAGHSVQENEEPGPRVLQGQRLVLLGSAQGVRKWTTKVHSGKLRVSVHTFVHAAYWSKV